MKVRSSIALLGVLAVLWGANWPIMKIGMEDVPPWVFRALASVSGGFGLLLIASYRHLPLRIPSGQLGALAFSAVLNMAVWNILVLYGLAFMNSGRAAILAYTMPLWASLLGALVLKEGLTLRSGFALLLGMAGMALLFFDEFKTLNGNVLGPLLVVLGAMSWAAGTVAVKYYAFAMPVIVLTAWQHLLGAIPLLFVAVIWDIHNVDSVSLASALCVLYNMTVTGIFCYWAYFEVVTRLPVVASTVGTLMVPVCGIFFDSMVFNTMPKWVDYLALITVAGAVILVVRGPGKPPPPRRAETA